MIPGPAQYLLRFDDLCPTLSRPRWERFLPLIDEFGIQPILAVVPDNQDPELVLSEPDPEFWSQMRAMEIAGATIALHGYQHLCESRGRNLLPLHARTEFAGVSEEVQRQWIHAGLETLRGYGLNPRLWVAPRHGFDRATLCALRQEGLGYLSDGFARIPSSRGGVTWIPQQLWGPVHKSKGLWTICIHSNTAEDSLVNRLRDFLQNHAAQLTSFERVLAEYNPAELGTAEMVHEALALWRIQASSWTRRRLHELKGG
jgi:hypothetical protein